MKEIMIVIGGVLLVLGIVGIGTSDIRNSATVSDGITVSDNSIAASELEEPTIETACVFNDKLIIFENVNTTRMYDSGIAIYFNDDSFVFFTISTNCFYTSGGKYPAEFMTEILTE